MISRKEADREQRLNEFWRRFCGELRELRREQGDPPMAEVVHSMVPEHRGPYSVKRVYVGNRPVATIIASDDRVSWYRG
jgi:ribosomal protein L32E